MTAPDKIWPEWMDLGKSECGWSNVAADEGNRARYHHQRTVDELLAALEVFAKGADGRKRKDIWGGVCFNQDALLRARALIAKHRKGG